MDKFTQPPQELPTTQPVRFVAVGGFLGSGKTTALASLARRIIQRGLRVGVITNDQTVNLVDTAIVKEMLRDLNVPVAEVAGGCFCCSFNDLINTTAQVLAHQPDVLLGEPVGSCTDFAAAVASPLITFYGEKFKIAPFSVLTDPQRVRELLLNETPTRFPDEVIYLYRKQMEEADIIVLNKVDQFPSAEIERFITALSTQFPDKPVLPVAAKHGTNVDEWLDLLINPEASGGRRILKELDYDRYAAAEATLGWLNATVELSAVRAFEATAFAQQLLAELHRAVKAHDSEVAHLKFLINNGGRSLWVNLTRTDGEATFGGSDIGAITEAMLTINARVQADPDELEALVRNAVAAAATGTITANVLELQSFRPAYPNPPYRMAELVS